MTEESPPAVGHRLGATLSLLTGLQILASLGLQLYLLARLGAGVATDAFYAGATAAQLIAVIAIDTLSVVLVPLLASKSEAQLRSDAWSLCLAAMTGFTGIALVLSLFAPGLTSIIVPGFSPEAKALTTSLTRIHLLGMGGTACTLVLTSIYQVRHKFLWPPLAALGSSLASMVLVIVMLDGWGVAVAAWAQVLAYSFPAVVMLAGLGRPARLEWRWDLVREVFSRQRPLMMAKAYFAASAPIDRLLISFLPAGSLVIFELVGRIFAAAQRVISQGVLAPVLPQLSRLAKDRQWTAFRSVCGRQAMWVVGLSLLVVVGIEVAAIATLAWLPDGHSTVVGNVTTDNLRQLAWLAALLSGVLPCSVLANAFGNAYYAQGDTSTPSRIGVAAFTIGLVLRTLGFLLGGIAGLAASATVSAVLTVTWIGVTLNTSTAKLARDRARHFGSSRFSTLREANPS